MIPLAASAASRIRGKPRASGDDPTRWRSRASAVSVNPARAGMIPCSILSGRPSGCKPRASGDDPEEGGPGQGHGG